MTCGNRRKLTLEIFESHLTRSSEWSIMLRDLRVSSVENDLSDYLIFCSKKSDYDLNI